MEEIFISKIPDEENVFVYFYNLESLEEGIQKLKVHDIRYASYYEDNIKYFESFSSKQPENEGLTLYDISSYIDENGNISDKLFYSSTDAMYENNAFNICSFNENMIIPVYQKDLKVFIKRQTKKIKKAKKHLIKE